MSAESSKPPGDRPGIESPLARADVPVFSCLVYVAQEADGRVRARVANLAGIEATGSNEREALAQIVRHFKLRVGQLLQAKTAIAWLDPPLPPEPGEQERFIPVHL